MKDTRSNVERASSGLVIALFLTAALLVGFILVMLLRDNNERTAPLENAASHVSQSYIVLISQPPDA